MQKGINLLPEELRVRKRFNVSEKLPLVIILTFFCVLLVVSAFLLWRVVSGERYLRTIETELVQVQPAAIRAEKKANQIKEMERSLRQLQQICDQRLLWDPVLEKINDMIPQDAWLVSFSAETAGNLRIQGKARTLSSIAVLVNRLNLYPYFKDVSMQKAEEVGNLIVFEVIGKVDQGGDW